MACQVKVMCSVMVKTQSVRESQYIEQEIEALGDSLDRETRSYSTTNIY